jgi:hypothetical protein
MTPRRTGLSAVRSARTSSELHIAETLPFWLSSISSFEALPGLFRARLAHIPLPA